MKYNDLEINKVYQKTNMSDAEKKQLLANCLDKRQQIVSGNKSHTESVVSHEELSARRNEKMKKSERKISVLKTVVVASVSIVATAAIVMGVRNYQSSNKATVGKEIKKIEDCVKVLPDSYIGGEPIRIGDYNFKYSEGGKGVAVKNIDEKEYIDLPDIKGFDVYSNGEYAYYCVKQYLYKYNLKTNEVDKVQVYNRDGEKKHEITNRLTVEAGKMGNIYMNCGHDDEINIYVYNIAKDEIKILKDVRIYVDLGDYMVCEAFGTIKKDESTQYDSKNFSICKYTKDGIKELRMIETAKDNLPCYNVSFYNCNLRRTKDDVIICDSTLDGKLYIGVNEKYSMDIKEINDDTPYNDIWDGSEITIYTFDSKTEDYEKIGVLKASDLGFEDGKQYIDIKSIYDNHWFVSVGNVDDETDGLDGEYDAYVQYDYYYKTKKFEVNKNHY